MYRAASTPRGRRNRSAPRSTRHSAIDDRRRPSERCANAVGRTAHPCLTKAQRHDVRVGRELRELLRNQSHAPRIEGLRRIGAVRRVHEGDRVAGERNPPFSRLDVPVRELEGLGAGRGAGQEEYRPPSADRQVVGPFALREKASLAPVVVDRCDGAPRREGARPGAITAQLVSGCDYAEICPVRSEGWCGFFGSGDVLVIGLNSLETKARSNNRSV